MLPRQAYHPRAFAQRSRDHQTKNALALSTRSAALLIPDDKAREELTPRAIALVQDAAQCASLSEEIRKLALTEAADRIVDEAERLVAFAPKR